MSDWWDHWGTAAVDAQAQLEQAEEQITKLREAIAAWPQVYAEVTDDAVMHSNSDEANAARTHARRVAGLED